MGLGEIRAEEGLEVAGGDVEEDGGREEREGDRFDRECEKEIVMGEGGEAELLVW